MKIIVNKSIEAKGSYGLNGRMYFNDWFSIGHGEKVAAPTNWPMNVIIHCGHSQVAHRRTGFANAAKWKLIQKAIIDAIICLDKYN